MYVDTYKTVRDWVFSALPLALPDIIKDYLVVGSSVSFAYCVSERLEGDSPGKSLARELDDLVTPDLNDEAESGTKNITLPNSISKRLQILLAEIKPLALLVVRRRAKSLASNVRQQAYLLGFWPVSVAHRATLCFHYEWQYFKQVYVEKIPPGNCGDAFCPIQAGLLAYMSRAHRLRFKVFGAMALGSFLMSFIIFDFHHQ